MYSQDLFEQNINDFILIKTISLPDSDLLIYKKLINLEPDLGNISYIFNATFSGKIEFRGYDIEKVDTNSTKELELIGRITNTIKITYYWKCIEKIDGNYKISVHFKDDDGNIIFGQDH